MMAMSSTVYQDVANWALAQQEHEQKNGEPAALTQAVRKALMDLHKLIKPSPVPKEPELGDTNWIGLLHRFHDAHLDVSGVGVSFEETSIGFGQELRWKGTVLIKENSKSFPHGSEPPSFARKKDAKQYAAKCAIEWLRTQELMPSSGDEVKFPKPVVVSNPMASPKHKKHRIAPPSPPAVRKELSSFSSLSSAESSASPSPGPGPKSASGTPLSPGIKSPFDAEEVSACHLVSECCKRLGLRAPLYKLEAHKTMAGFWSGYPQFDVTESSDFPEGLGYVKDVMGKKYAKEKIAEKVLKHLLKLEEQRGEETKRILASLASPPTPPETR